MEPAPEPEPARPDLEPALAVRRIELSWVQLQRRRAREVDGAAVQIQRIYRGRNGRRRGSAPDGAVPTEPIASGGALVGEEKMEGLAGGLPRSGGSLDGKAMTAASYHKQQMRATRQRSDGWRPPGFPARDFVSGVGPESQQPHLSPAPRR